MAARCFPEENESIDLKNRFSYLSFSMKHSHLEGIEVRDCRI